jgi:HEPN domain-containing protein
VCSYIYALLKRPQLETQALIEAAEYVNIDLEYAKRDLEYAKRDLECAKRDLEYVKSDLPPPSLRPIPTKASRKRDLEYVKRDLEYAKRDLEYVKRDLPPPSLRPIILTNASRNSFLSRVSDEECAVRLLGMSQQCAS